MSRFSIMRCLAAHWDNYNKLSCSEMSALYFKNAKQTSYIYCKKQEQWTPSASASLSVAENFSAQVSICLSKQESRNYISGHFRGYNPELARPGILNSRANSRTVTEMDKSLQSHLWMETWWCSIKALYSSLSPTEHALPGPFRVLTENWA